MITLSTNLDKITLSGETYTRRHAIRAMGGTFDNVTKNWTVPNTGDNLAKCEALARDANAAQSAHSGLAAKVESARAAMPETQQAAKSGAPDLVAAMAAFVAQHQAGAVDPAQVRAIVAETIRPLEARIDNRPHVVTLEIKRPDAEAFKLDGLAHAMLPTLIRALSAGLHVWLAGPSGSGKTHGAEQAAKALGLTFRLQGAMTMAHELTGFVDAGGKYHETPFVTTFRSGGVILLDELDAGSNEALLALNAALANGVMCLPSGEIIRAHADFKCVGAANTFGTGATSEYVGRTRIDAAFLQRFGVRLMWGYDEALEVAMSGNADWAKRVQRARKAAATHGLKVLITPRSSQAGARLIAQGFTPDEAANLTYLADLSPDQRRMIEG